MRDRRIVSSGYNGTPEGMTNCSDGGCHRCANRELYPSGTAYDLCICVHAEQNALLAAARFGISVENATVYTTVRPCFGCTKEMLQAHISKVYYLHDWKHPDAAKQQQYEILQARFPEGIERLVMPDALSEWASSKSGAHSSITDEHGHATM